MRITFLSAVLAACAVAKPMWIPPDKVNRIRGLDIDGDYRMASCELHHSNDLDTKLKNILERNLTGTIFVEQQYLSGSGGW